MPLPSPRSLYFGLNSINFLRRDSFGCESIPSCNCPGKERKFQPVHICIWNVILKGVWYSCYQPQTDFYSCQWWLDYCAFYRRRSKRSAVSVPGIHLAFLQRDWLRHCLKAQRAEVLWTFSILLISVWWWGFNIGAAYTNWGRTRALYAATLVSLEPGWSFGIGNPVS